ncbi:uncharacterized protein [Dysidea avara]|uniref:uncharacterized protein isoform X1 n=2 Tax=Dysidea avara TaxID=196820 RepID=UPI0033195E2E
MIIACLLLAMGYAKCIRPTERPATPAPEPMESGCLAEMQAQQEFMIQSNLPRRFLVVARKGSRRMFGRTFDNVNGQSNIQIATAGDGYNITNGISVITTTNDGAEQILKNKNVERVEEDKPMCVDLLKPDNETETDNGRSRRSSEPDEICWNIDRLDERSLPLDGDYCPLVQGNGVDVYIFDTGIRYSHQVFGGRASFGGYDEFGGQGDDNNGHGTHCAGLAVGRLTGVAWGARVYSIKVLDSQMRGFFSYVINGINHVISRARSTGRRSVISMSLIGPITAPVNDAIREAVANNIVVVTAAGNFRQDSCGFSPSSSPDVINVGAIQEAEDPDSRTPGHQLYWFNSRPNSPGSNYGRCVDILAPGQWIRSASYTSDRDRVSMSGTSMACPTVAGAVALLLQRFPSYSPAQIKRQLQDEATQGAINMRTYRGGFLPTIIRAETTNRLVYTGKSRQCAAESDRPTATRPPGSTAPTTPAPIPGCYFDGIFYEHNRRISQNCSSSCVCKRGTWKCQPRDCYTDYCQAYSYGHYRTFDGSQYTYLGSCEYVLAKPCDNDDFTITVTQRALDSNSVLIDQVTVSVPSQNLVIVLRGGDNQVTINGRNFSAVDGSMMSVGEVKVEWIGSYPHVTFEDIDLDIFWDDAGSLQVSASNSLRRQLCGLCGFYNGDDSDDYRMRDGTTSSGVRRFARSWLTEDISGGCRDRRLDNTCNERNMNRAQRECAMLNNAPFDSCHSAVDPKVYIENCESDYCTCVRTRNRDTCSCNVMANYARACAKAGVDVSTWRDVTGCSDDCVGGRVYKECGTLCQSTCDNHQSPPFCSSDCTPTCVCPEGQVLRNGQCIETDQCDAPPPCKGTPLPSSTPFFFERFYLGELEEFIEEGRKRNRVPCHMNTYHDSRDTLFSIIFCSVPDVSQYEIVHGLSTRNLNRRANELRKTHRIHNFVCYNDDNDRSRCVAVFEPVTRQQWRTEKTELMINVPYDEYQQRLLILKDQGMRVLRRNIYSSGGDLSVSAIFRSPGYAISLRDGIDIRGLVQLIERNKERGFFLADGNARMDGDQVIYSVVFTTQRFGNCDYRVEYNVDAMQLFNREQKYAKDGCHITVIIPNTGSLTPQFIAVFWCTD